MVKQADPYLTEDLGLAAFLTASGKSKLTAIVNSNSWKKSFRLSPSPSEADIATYYTGQAKVSALRLYETLRSLKTAIRESEKTSCV